MNQQIEDAVERERREFERDVVIPYLRSKGIELTPHNIRLEAKHRGAYRPWGPW